MYSLCPRAISLRDDSPEAKELSGFVSKILDALEAKFQFSFPFVSKVANAAFRPADIDASAQAFKNLAADYTNLQQLNPGHFLVIAYRLLKDNCPHTMLFLPAYFDHNRPVSAQLLCVENGPLGNSPETVGFFRRYYENIANFRRATHIATEQSAPPNLRARARVWLCEAFYGGLHYLQGALEAGLDRLWIHDFGGVPRYMLSFEQQHSMSYFPVLKPLLSLYFASSPDDVLVSLPKFRRANAAILDCARYALLRVLVRDSVLLRVVKHVYKMLFRAAFEMNDPRREAVFADMIPSSLRLTRVPIRQVDHSDFILANFKARFPRATEPGWVWCMPWMQASTLVKSRNVLLIKGYAYVTYMDAYTAFFHDAIGSAVERAALVDYEQNFQPVVDAHCKYRKKPPTVVIPHPKDIEAFKMRLISYEKAKNHARSIAEEYWKGLPLNPVTEYGYGHYLIDNTARDWFHSPLRADISRSIESDRLSRSMSGLAASRFAPERLRRIFAAAVEHFCTKVDPVGKWKVRLDSQKRGVVVLDRGAASVCALCSERAQKTHVHEVDNTAFLCLRRDGSAVEWGCWRGGHAQRRLVLPTTAVKQ